MILRMATTPRKPLPKHTISCKKKAKTILNLLQILFKTKIIYHIKTQKTKKKLITTKKKPTKIKIYEE